MGKAVFVVGSINQDTRLRVHDHPRTGQTVTARSEGSDLGGKGANQAIATARAGARTRFVGAVGDDAAGRTLRERLGDEGIDITHVTVREEETTGSAIVMLDDAGDNLIVITAGANGALSSSEVSDGLAEAAADDIVLAQLETSAESLRAALEIARRRGCRTVVNAAPFRSDIIDLLDRIDVLIVNEHELDDLGTALKLSGERTDVARTLASRYACSVVCTLGSDGSFAATATDTHRFSADPVDVVDTTGAGDTFTGFFAAGLADRLPLTESMEWAGHAAGLAVTRAGASRAIPYRNESPVPIAAKHPHPR